MKWNITEGRLWLKIYIVNIGETIKTTQRHIRKNTFTVCSSNLIEPITEKKGGEQMEQKQLRWQILIQSYQ